jgi:hypothetical protein
VLQKQQPAAAVRGNRHRLNVSAMLSKLASEKCSAATPPLPSARKSTRGRRNQGNAIGAALAAPWGGAGSAACAAASARDGGDGQRSCGWFLAEPCGGSRLAGVGEDRGIAAGGQPLRARSERLGLDLLQGSADAAAGAPQ